MEDLFLNNTVTKSLEPINSDERFFEGYLTVEVKDKQGEITIVAELIKVLPIWLDRGAPISDTHSNRIIGKGISYAQTVYKDSSGAEFPAIILLPSHLLRGTSCLTHEGNITTFPAFAATFFLDLLNTKGDDPLGVLTK